jgi:hypothetical protein
MRYLPPFDRLKEFLQISTVKGELRVAASYDDFVTMIKLLLSGSTVDEEWYLERYPDVADAINAGMFRSAKHHFVENGYFEGRFPTEPVVDEVWYLQRYPDVAQSVEQGHFSSALRHFIEDGYKEGRMPFGY